MTGGRSTDTRTFWLGLTLAATVGLIALGAEGLTREPQAVSFTSAQVARGKAVFAQACAACHGAALTGGAAPPLTGTPFEASWSHPQVTLDDWS